MGWTESIDRISPKAGLHLRNYSTRVAWDMHRQKVKSLLANTEVSPFPGFLGCQSPLDCEGSECHHLRCFRKAKRPKGETRLQKNQEPSIVQELDQPRFWVLKLEPKPHHQKMIQKMLSSVRGTGHKQQDDTLPPQHKSLGVKGLRLCTLLLPKG